MRTVGYICEINCLPYIDKMTKKEKILFVLILFFLTTLFLPWLKLANIFAAIFLGVYSFFFDLFEEDSLRIRKENLFYSLKGKWLLLE